jgi:hypothetical protein
MARNGNVPELLERFMEQSGETRRWVTVREIRTYFDLGETASPAISGFLQRICPDPFFSFPYRVERIEKVVLSQPHRRVVKRYLVARRPQPRIRDHRQTLPKTGRGPAPVFTDYDALEHFNRVLQKNA